MKTLLIFVVSLHAAVAMGAGLSAELKSKLVTYIPLTKETALLVIVAKDEAVAAKKGLTADAPIDHWYFLGDSYSDHRLIGSGMAGMRVVGSISKSPDGKYLAVESAGEGVSLVEIVKIESLISQGKYKLTWDSSEAMNCDLPGWIRSKKWKGQNLIVQADRWLPNCKDKKLHKNREFSIDAKSGKISPL